MIKDQAIVGIRYLITFHKKHISPLFLPCGIRDETLSHYVSEGRELPQNKSKKQNMMKLLLSFIGNYCISQV